MLTVIFIFVVLFLLKISYQPHKMEQKQKIAQLREQFLMGADTGYTIHVTSIEGNATFWKITQAPQEMKAFSIVLRRDGITIYDETRGRKPLLIVPYHAVRGIFYSVSEYGHAHRMEMHFLDRGQWQVFSIPYESIRQKNFNPLLSELEERIDDSRYTVFRKEWFILSDAINAYIVTQNLTGTWQRKRLITVFIMPLYFVLIGHDGKTKQVIPADSVRDIIHTFDGDLVHHVISIRTYDGADYHLALYTRKSVNDIAKAVADIQGLDTHDILIPAQKSKEIASGSHLHRKMKNKAVK